ncbi:NYN domain-containing protein [Synechococcus sp. H55.11]|uniref:NYN domain-containing protein n=1 Tax=Synechococcus sp. H55.11 TaxID=2967121 RepID=UPI0039C120EF
MSMGRTSTFSLTWLWTGSLALGVTALVTRQVVWGLLPVAAAYPAIRRREEQLCQVLGQSWQQQEQMATQLGAIQARIDALEARPTSHLSVRQQLAPTTQAIQQIQRRLKAVELRLNALPQATPEELESMRAQLQRLQQQVESQPALPSPRKALGVFIDGANLHASAQQSGSPLDYPGLLSWLAQGRTEMEVHFYSGTDPHNLGQRRFLAELRKLGYRVVTKPVVTRADGSRKANLDGELIVDLMTLYSRYETVLLLSGDGDFAPALRHIRSQGCRLEVAAYRPSTHPELIRLADRFVDLCAWQGTGIPVPLPAKQTAASG